MILISSGWFLFWWNSEAFQYSLAPGIWSSANSAGLRTSITSSKPPICLTYSLARYVLTVHENHFVSEWLPRREIGNNATCRLGQAHWAGAAALHPGTPESPLKPQHHHSCALKWLLTEGHTSCSGPKNSQPQQPWPGRWQLIRLRGGCVVHCYCIVQDLTVENPFLSYHILWYLFWCFNYYSPWCFCD